MKQTKKILRIKIEIEIELLFIIYLIYIYQMIQIADSDQINLLDQNRQFRIMVNR